MTSREVGRAVGRHGGDSTAAGFRFDDFDRDPLMVALGVTVLEIKDLADVQELVRVLNLLRDFSANLNESVRDKYHELWDDARR